MGMLNSCKKAEEYDITYADFEGAKRISTIWESIVAI
jgi:hypothetical protein